MGPDPSVPSLNAVIARNVRALRQERGWTQEMFATRLRTAGFGGWTRSVVAALETRRRQVSVGDLVPLCLGLGAPPARLVAGEHGFVRLDDGTEVPIEVVGAVVASKVRDAKRILGPMPPVMPGTDSEPDRIVTVAARGELERRIAASFGVSPEEVVEAALRLWGSPPTAERDRRAPEGPGPKRAVSRRIREEIESLLRPQ